MHDQKDVDRLIQVLLCNERYVPDVVQKALEPFHEPRPRVGTLVIKKNDPTFPNATTVINDGGIELTEAVRKALDEAGVDYE